MGIKKGNCRDFHRIEPSILNLINNGAFYQKSYGGGMIPRIKLLEGNLGIRLFVGLFLFSILNGAEPADTNYLEEKVPKYRLPKLLKSDLKGAETVREWYEKRRPELQTLLETHIYGKTPTRDLGPFQTRIVDIDPQALNGRATRKQISITIDDKLQLSIDLLVYLPNQAEEQVPCFMGLNFYGNQTVHADPKIRINPRWMGGKSKIGIKNNRATEATRGVYHERWQIERLIKRGYAVATAYCGDIDPDNYQHDFSDGIHPLFYRDNQSKPDPGEWGTIGAWAWGLSRILDYIIESESAINAKQVAVIGHSRLGKTALWAGAQDQRFGLVISNNSGCGGAALYRREFGERIHHMIKPVGYWFCGNHANFSHREQELPADQHMLLALVAPRPLYVASATEDQWADPKGEFLAALAASPVYELLGKTGLPSPQMPEPNTPVQGTIGYHLRNGAHAVTAYDWEQYLSFADRHFKR